MWKSEHVGWRIGARSRALSVAARLAATTLTLTTGALATSTTLAALTPANASASTISWSGAGDTSAWSATANWSSSGTAPTTNASITEANFFDLGSACASATPTTACYTTDNDVSGLKVDFLDLDYSRPYVISGDQFTLGADGLEADTDASAPADNPARIDAPISLSANQTWVLNSNSSPQRLMVDQVSEPFGDSYSLNIKMGSLSTLQLTDNLETGPVTVQGGDLTLGDSSSSAEINGQNGQLLTLAGSNTDFSVVSPGSYSGPIFDDGANIFVGVGGNGLPGTLDALGSVDLDSTATLTLGIAAPGTTPGVDASQLTSESAFYPAGATLKVDLVPANGVCHDLHVGDVYTLIEAKGGISGPLFSGLPDGATVPISNACNSGSDAAGVLHYTANTVTLTVTAAGNAGDGPTPITAPTISGTPTVGSTLSVNPGTWAGLPSTFTYAWLRCTSAVACTTVASSQSYTLTNADLGTFLYAVVKATNAVSDDYQTLGPTATVTSASTTPTTPTTPTTTTTVDPAAIRAALMNALKVGGQLAHRAKLLKAGGYRTSFAAPQACKLSLSWMVTERIKHKRIHVTVATLTKTIAKSGTFALKINLTPAGRKLLRAAHGALTLTATGTCTPAGTSAPITATRTIKLTP